MFGCQRRNVLMLKTVSGHYLKLVSDIFLHAYSLFQKIQIFLIFIGTFCFPIENYYDLEPTAPLGLMS